MPVDVTIPVQELTDVASARREALEVARLAGLDQNAAGAVGIVVTEAATNLLKHGGGGDLIARQLRGGEHPVLEIVAMDRGQGMADTARCSEDGYSTAGSPGNGLGAIARLSLFHHIYSLPGSGTVLVAHVGKHFSPPDFVQVGALSLPYPGEPVCGDAWGVHTSPRRCRLVVADGLGHGLLASEAARAAVGLMTDDRATSALLLMDAMHQRLRPTRGAAVAIADIDFAADELSFTAIGNIAGCIVHPLNARRQMISMNGTVGHQMHTPRTYTYPLPPGSLVILHSDGLSTHWSLDKYPGLLGCGASVIAAVLMRDFRRTRDDATVVVVRAAEPSS